LIRRLSIKIGTMAALRLLVDSEITLIKQHTASTAESGNIAYKKVFKDLLPYHAVGRNTPIRLLKIK
jgi:hypothetical protein